MTLWDGVPEKSELKSQQRDLVSVGNFCWSPLVSFGLLWSIFFGLRWSPLVSFGLFFLVSVGLLWSPLVSFGLLWSIFVGLLSPLASPKRSTLTGVLEHP